MVAQALMHVCPHLLAADALLGEDVGLVFVLMDARGSGDGRAVKDLGHPCVAQKINGNPNCRH